MFNQEVTSVRLERPCPVCDGFLKLLSMDSEPWSSRTMGERVRFRCASCGMTRSEWSAIAVAAPSTVPD